MARKKKVIADDKSQNNNSRTASNDENWEDPIKMLYELFKKDPEIVKSELTRLYTEKEPPLTAAEWAKTRPLEMKTGGDKFYAKLVNDIKETIRDGIFSEQLPKGLFMTIAKACAAYLEDCVSETHVFQAIRNLYRREYGKFLPFYDVNESDYFEDDINIEDIKLIIWQSYNLCGAYEERIFSPISPGFDIMADEIFDILVDRFDKAPRSNRTSDVIKKACKTDDFYLLRSLGLWLSADFPLTAIPFLNYRMEKEFEVSMRKKSNTYQLSHMDPGQIYYYIKANNGWSKYITMLGCSSSMLLSEIVRLHGFDKIADKLLTIGDPITGLFRIQEVTAKEFKVKDEYGEVYNVSKDSFNITLDFNRVKAFTGTLYRYGDEYMQNGVASFFTEEIPEDETKLPSDRIPLKVQTEIAGIITKHDGRQIFYCKNFKEVSEIVGSEIKPVAPPDLDEEDKELYEKPENLLLMITKKGALIMLPNYCSIFKDPDNPFCKSRRYKEMGKDQFNFLMANHLPDDLIDYIVAKNIFPYAWMYTSQGYKPGKEIVQENMGLLARFARVPGYPAPGSESDLEEDEYLD